jgi:chemotaxis protein MotB
MQTANKKTIVLLNCLVLTTFLAGCGGFPTNWKKKHDILDVAYRNLDGRYQNLKQKSAERILQDQRTIAELQKQIEERKQSPAVATGFGEGYIVDFDPSAGTITVTLPNTILFSSGEATLKKATNTDLNHIQSVLQSRYPGRQIDVVGHTDSDPIKVTKDKWKDNLELSSQRALTVTRYLIKRGIPKDKIRAVGCGATRPIASNATASGKAKNRRVEIVVYMR